MRTGVVVAFLAANNWFGAWIPGAWPEGWKVAGFDASGTHVALIAGPQ